jgi:hypothetical protein
MKARTLFGGLVVALLLAGCVTPEQRYVRECEARLKQTFGDYSARYDRYSAVARPDRHPSAPSAEHGS